MDNPQENKEYLFILVLSSETKRYAPYSPHFSFFNFEGIFIRAEARWGSEAREHKNPPLSSEMGVR